jgi:two-component system, NarL family, nitrate/nitrite response regulator NarL
VLSSTPPPSDDLDLPAAVQTVLIAPASTRRPLHRFVRLGGDPLYRLFGKLLMTRVFIVVGIRLYREGLAQLLSTQEGLTVVGTAASGRSAATQIEQLTPDVALVEMGIPDLDTIAGALAASSSPIPLVAIGIADSDSEVVACAERGAAGYVTCDASVEELAGTIERAARGELMCSARTAGTLIRRLGTLAAELKPSPPAARLTRREREVGALMGEDLTNKEIASRLRIEVATVKNHVHNVLDKLQVHRRAEVARLLGPMTRSSR